MGEHSHEEMLVRLADLEEQVGALRAWVRQHQRQSMDSALAALGPDAPSPEAQREIERILGFAPTFRRQ
jgi:hypothetical protein